MNRDDGKRQPRAVWDGGAGGGPTMNRDKGEKKECGGRGHRVGVSSDQWE